MSAALHTAWLVPVGSAVGDGSATTLCDALVTVGPGVHHGLLATCSASTASEEWPGPGFVDEHLVLDLTEPGGLRWRRHADVLHLGPVPEADVHARLAELLSAHPGCAVATAVHRPGTVVVLARNGDRLVLRASAPAGGPVPPPVLGSLAHAWLAAGRALTELRRISAAVPGSGLVIPPVRPDGG
ncbi:hypothetical protein ACFRAR_10505 [Kitasatospora sp. NPDC056651]|uniref:hypothetical protein n=1 Tax=Kitasatospora sp. NPDC056651 TaxID=3345892 RepID=UPI0036BF29A5